jgi:hypothetical protein
MDDPFPDWRCLTCGLVTTGSRVADDGAEVVRTECKFCGTPKPDLAGWAYVSPWKDQHGVWLGAFWRHPTDVG